MWSDASLEMLRQRLHCARFVPDSKPLLSKDAGFVHFLQALKIPSTIQVRRTKPFGPYRWDEAKSRLTCR